MFKNEGNGTGMTLIPRIITNNIRANLSNPCHLCYILQNLNSLAVDSIKHITV